MWRVFLTASDDDDVGKALLQKGGHPEAVCSLVRESSDLKGIINLFGASTSPDILYARGARQESVEGPDMVNQALDKALREPAARCESESIGLRLATHYHEAQKRRRGTSGEVTRNEGRVLNHLCWTDDLYATTGTMDHLTRILVVLTNSIERLVALRWRVEGVKQYTSFVTFSCNEHELIVAHHTAWLVRLSVL